MPQRPSRLDPSASALARFGARLRDYRLQQNWAQAELGRRVHVSGTLIAKMERAERRPQPEVARALDEVLGADGELVALATDARQHPLRALTATGAAFDWQPAAAPRAVWSAGVDELRRLATVYDLPPDGPVRPLPDLRTAVRTLIYWRLNSDYWRLMKAVPELVPELTRAMLGSSGRRREQVAGWLVQAWRAADAVAAKSACADLSAQLIHVMGWAAAQSGDGLAQAATAYVRAETFFDSRQQRAGHRMLELAAQRVAADRPGGITMDAPVGMAAQYGALHMRAAVAAARAELGDRARDHLVEARRVARWVPEDVWEGTAFGPSSVRIHEVATFVELHDPQQALLAAGPWRPPETLPAQRRSHFYVDLGRAHFAVGNLEEALAALNAARSIAPQNVQADADVRHALAVIEAERGPVDLSG